MTGRLQRPLRDRLLADAQQAARELPPETLKQSAAALTILRTQGSQALELALSPQIVVKLGAASRHWDNFRGRCGPAVRRAAEEGPGATAYLLVWLKRLAAMAELERRAGARRPQRQRARH